MTDTDIRPAIGVTIEAPLPVVICPVALATTADTYMVPMLIANEGNATGWRYVKFFTANINNPNTRRAYARACAHFFAWYETRGGALGAICPFDGAAWVNELLEEHGAAGVKQQLAAARMLFDWLVVGQVVPMNPAAAVRGPKHVVKTGKTPVLDGAEWRQLIDSIPTESVDCKGWLFRTSPGHNGIVLTKQPMDQSAAWLMIRRPAAAAGIHTPIGNHTFRATGITAYLFNGGAVEHAQSMAAHESPRTTKLYDRTNDRLMQDEVERIRL